jgi:hypothetical protein
MRKTLILALALVIVTTSAFAQVRTPRVSPNASLTQSVGLTDITIKYSRPGVKGRTIWGGLVPYDQVWRTGANEATTITFSDDVTVDGQKLAKGTYALFTVPSRNTWAVVFNKQGEQWGAFNYDQAQDAARINVTPQKAEFREWMGFEINDITTDTAKVVLRWENVAVPFTVNTDSTAKTLKNLKAAMQPTWQVPYSAASFAFENKGSATDQEISDWLDKSLAISENTANLWLKARFLQRLGKTAEAKAAAEKAIAVARPDQKDFVNEIKRLSANW